MLAWQDTMRVGLFEWQRGLDSVYSKKSFPRSPQKCGISEAACAERRCHAPVDTRRRARRHRKWIAGLASKGKGTVATPPEGMPSTGFPRGSRFGVGAWCMATGPRPEPDAYSLNISDNFHRASLSSNPHPLHPGRHPPPYPIPNEPTGDFRAWVYSPPPHQTGGVTSSR